VVPGYYAFRASVRGAEFFNTGLCAARRKYSHEEYQRAERAGILVEGHVIPDEKKGSCYTSEGGGFTR
jgi:hypothetical protein